jgi:N-acetylneuraminate synthase
MATAVRDEGMITACTPFDEPSVGTILDHGIQIIKIASCSAMDWPLLEVVAKAKKPVVCSTGGLSIYDIDKIVSFLTHRESDFALLHCIGVYPMPNSEANLNFMERMRRRYPYVPIGYSGHEAPDNVDVVKIAVAKGATILERHVGYPTDKIRLNSYSMAAEQVDLWVENALRSREICGDPGGEKRVTQEEIESLLSLKRGVYAARSVRKGATIRQEDVFFAMPCNEEQTTSGEYQESMMASRSYKRNEPICERRTPSLVGSIRDIIHDAKGMLYEANVELGKDFEIELSHHYGMETFRQTGAIIVDLVNREYCKKIIVMLPAQQHPSHHHKIKEETFQLIWGDLEVVLKGTKVLMKPGDKLLVERAASHSFTTRNGAIFEEISTTHVKGDSYYEDERINALDPLKRKSVLENW